MLMANLDVKEFSSWLKKQVGMPYLWGGQNETLYDLIRKLAKSKNQSDSKTELMLKFLENIGIKDVHFFDCSGLGVDYLLKHNAITSDTTAAGLYKKCKPISAEEVEEGCWGFLKDKNGKIYHIGYMVDNDNIIHAFNQQKGVIIENRKIRKWIYAKPEFAFKFVEPQKLKYDDLTVGDKVTITNSIKGYNNANNALTSKNPTVTYPSGTYYVYKKYNGSVNISKIKGVPGAWVVL